jgi:hypothetical protein
VISDESYTCNIETLKFELERNKFFKKYRPLSHRLRIKNNLEGTLSKNCYLQKLQEVFNIVKFYNLNVAIIIYLIINIIA